MPKNAIPLKKSDVPQEPEAEKEPMEEKTERNEELKSVRDVVVPDRENITESKQDEVVVPAVPAAPNPEAEKDAIISERKPTKEAKAKKDTSAAASAVDKIDYTPGIGVKIIRRAEDEPKPAPRRPVPKKPTPDPDRKPKEYVPGRKDSAPGRKDAGATKEDQSPRKKRETPAPKKGEGKERVLVYTAPASGGDKKPRKGKGKGKNDKFESKPLNLTKATPKKRRKYKDKNDVVEENLMDTELLPEGSVVINVPITVAGFCEQIDRTSSDAIMALMKMGIMANINQNLDEETAVLLGIELGVNIVVNNVSEEVVEEGLDLSEDIASELVSRAPIIAVMGHVDHGKTSLLDAIRKSNVTDQEAGGITQHIGASEIELKGQRIVFLDTPGHEAFTAMRARGAHVTDIAVLVVAADDSVKPQTIESISHARAAGVPIIVAINKMDKPGADPDRVKKDLSEQGILVEEWGGDVISVPVSAKSGEGIIQLLEMILLQAEVLELKANPNRLAMGTVIEARLDKSKGPVATLLVTNGTLHAGMSVVAGTCSGRIRAMTNSKGETIRKAGPARAVEITGLTDVPQAGDEFNAVKEDKIAREIAENRKLKLRQEVLAKNSSITLEQLFSQIEEGEVKELNLILKADVQGSVGALEQSLEKLHNENVKVKIIHSGVGTITESDIMLASTSNAVIIGFNVRPSTAVSSMADQEKVEIRTYRIIYEIIDDIEAAIKGMLDPIFKEVVMGKIEVRETFKVPGAGIVAGAYVIEGKIMRNAKVRLVRDGIVIHEGTISSLRRFKDDVREVATGFECGIGLDKYNDIKEGDIIEAFSMVEIERK
ncbi:MAG: translation initiation factor IF-2 [Eubacteriales bacterium]|nr:translation initiation factor IF-2 [Eubacteriales bacterium]